MENCAFTQALVKGTFMVEIKCHKKPLAFICSYHLNLKYCYLVQVTPTDHLQLNTGL
jgi:hypothetical protein